MRGMRNAPMRGAGRGVTRPMGAGIAAGTPRLKSPIVQIFTVTTLGVAVPRGTRTIRVEALQAGFDSGNGNGTTFGGNGGRGGDFADVTLSVKSGLKTIDVTVGAVNGAHSIVTAGAASVRTDRDVTISGGAGGSGSTNNGTVNSGPGQVRTATPTQAQGGNFGFGQNTASPGGGGGGGAGPFAGGGGGGGAWNNSPGDGGLPSVGGTGLQGQRGKTKDPYAGGDGGVPGGGGGGNLGTMNTSYYGAIGLGARGEVRVTFA